MSIANLQMRSLHIRLNLHLKFILVLSLKFQNCCCNGYLTESIPDVLGSSSISDWSPGSNSAACVSESRNANCVESESEMTESVRENFPSKSPELEASNSNAIVLYTPPPFLESFYLNSRTFHLAGRDFSISQNWAEFGVAAVVWDAVIIF